MLVRQILAGKAQAGIISVKTSDTVSEAAAILAVKRIGAVIVSDDGSMVDGILSERDIVREIGLRGSGCLNETVAKIMTSSVTACHLGDTSNAILEQMTHGRFRHMPVIEDGGMVGVVTIGDIVKARISEVEWENTALTDMIAGH